MDGYYIVRGWCKKIRNRYTPSRRKIYLLPCAFVLVVLMYYKPVETATYDLTDQQEPDDDVPATEYRSIHRFPEEGRPKQTSLRTPRKRERMSHFLGRMDILHPAKNCTKRFPECIIIGVMKSGTDALTKYVSLHPKVAMAFQLPATAYFASNYHRGAEWYRRKMMCSTRDQVSMEKSPQYFTTHDAPTRIHAMSASVKLIMIVRDPVDRAVSHYLQVKAAHPDMATLPFKNMVMLKNGAVNKRSPFICQSRYSVHYQRWLSKFPKEQILVLNQDLLKRNPVKELRRVESFIGLKPYINNDMFTFDKEHKFYCIRVANQTTERCVPEGKRRVHPVLDKGLRDKLERYFRPFNDRFYKLTGIGYEWNKKTVQ